MVVDDARGLQVGIDGDGTKKGESPLLEVLADHIGEFILGYNNTPVCMTWVFHCLVPGKTPKIR